MVRAATTKGNEKGALFGRLFAPAVTRRTEASECPREWAISAWTLAVGTCTMCWRRHDANQEKLMRDLDPVHRQGERGDVVTQEARLIDRLRDFAHCNRSEHITAGEAVAAYVLISELQELRGLVASWRERVDDHGVLCLSDQELALLGDMGETPLARSLSH
jgi:hypothetical protein